MPTIGFTAYLKLLSLNPKPRDRELRKKFLGDGGGYDFHRRMRFAARRWLLGQASFDEVLADAAAIKGEHERRSYVEALHNLRAWRADNPGAVLGLLRKTHPSDLGLFEVVSQPDFGVLIDGQLVAIHIWNTKRTKLTASAVQAALSLLPGLYEGEEHAPDDFAVLSLQGAGLIRLSAIGVSKGAARLATSDLDQRIEKILGGGSPPPPPPPGAGIADRPPQ